VLKTVSEPGQPDRVTLQLGADLEVPLDAAGDPVVPQWRKHVHADVRRVGNTQSWR